MKQLLFVDCCIRGELSRTRELAEAFFAALPKGEYEVERLDLNAVRPQPLDRAAYLRREELLAEGKTDDEMFALSRQFAAADLVIVASPFWDMGIPALLKSYFERVSVSGIAFSADEEGNFAGLCRAEKMICFMTRGMDIPDGSESEQASPYLKALCRFFGIGGFEMVSVWGTDTSSPEEVARRLAEGKKVAAELGAAVSLL